MNDLPTEHEIPDHDALQAAGASQPPPLRDVAGKVAYVSGASSGIGLATARVLREAGMKVVLGYLADEQLQEATACFTPDDPDVMFLRHDVSDREGWERTAEAIEKRYGNTHLLVNNAGVGLSARANTGTLNDWEWGMEVNFWGAVHGVRTFLPRMRAHADGAHIVSVSSISGMFAGSGNGIYTISKYALCGLMEQLRTELHETNIGTSVIFPGMTTTNIGQAERYRPARFRNHGASEPQAAAPGPQPGAMMDPLEVAYCLLDGIRHNDLFIFSHPEWRRGAQARMDAIMSSFVDREVPAARVPPDPLRTPVYVREVAHRRKTARRAIKTV
jgi:NAD(P)-dependent dehydrogenase (short-subunit alcohol dehydrogenase family)